MPIIMTVAFAATITAAVTLIIRGFRLPEQTAQIYRIPDDRDEDLDEEPDDWDDFSDETEE